MNEHQRIIQESKYLDRASDCSAEIADEVQNEDDDTFFKSESYQEIYKSSVNSNQEKIKIVFNSCQHKQIVEEKWTKYSLLFTLEAQGHRYSLQYTVTSSLSPSTLIFKVNENKFHIPNTMKRWQEKI